jgi:hypothetical protein
MKTFPLKTTARFFSAMLLSVGSFAIPAHAQLTQLTEITWGGTTGTRDWHTGSNWIGGVVPDTPATPDPETGKSLQIANLAVNLGSNLTVDLGSTDARIAQLRLGSMSSAITTNIIGGTGRLVFRNDDPSILTNIANADFDNNGRVNGRDFLIWRRQCRSGC